MVMDVYLIQLYLFTAFVVKHFICDFLRQRWPYMYLNKGTYLHLGGLLHAGIHALGTALVVFPFTEPPQAAIALQAATIDFLVHYHTDLAKVKLCKRWGLKPDNSEWYWHLLGLDQLIHYLTYVGIIWWLFL